MTDQITMLVNLPHEERDTIDRLSATYHVSPGDMAAFCILLGLEAIEAGQVDLADYLIPVQPPPHLELDLSPKMQATVDRLAARAGVSPDEIVRQAVERSYAAFKNGQLTLADLLARLEEKSNG